MLAKLLLLASVATAPGPSPAQGADRLELHEHLESSALMDASLRLLPLAGRLEIREGMPDGSWLPADGKSGARWVSRHQFRVDYDPADAHLLLHAWSRQGQSLALEHPVQGALAGAQPNTLRIEVANFDANASVRIEDLALQLGERRLSVRDFGRGVMTSDLATAWEPGLADGFTLSGTIRVEGAVRPADARVWIDVGLGHSRRVAVEVEGYGWLHSEPAGLAAVPGQKEAVGLFAVDQAIRLQAIEDPAARRAFQGWGEGQALDTLVLAPGATPVTTSARFAAGPADLEAAQTPAATARTPEGGLVFTNNAPITVPAGAPGTTQGPASPYPSTISVSGPVGGAITDVNVKLENVTHTHPDDLDILLVSPIGRAVILMSDACGDTDIANFDWTFDDAAAAQMPDSTVCTSFFYRPTNFGTGDPFPEPAPATTTGSTMAEFNQENPNGTWRLFVVDDALGDVGAINGGWQLQLTTEPYQILIPGTGSSGIANPYPSVRSVSPTHTLFGAILDVDVTLTDMTHSHGDDLDVLVVGPGGAASILMSDACGSEDFLNYIWTFDDEAPAPMSDTELAGCNPFDVQPTNHGAGADTWPAPAPAGPFTASLANLDGQVGTGLWGLFIVDDASSDVGFLEGDWFVELTLDGIFRDDFEL